MENIDFATLFQGFGTMMESGCLLASARVFLILLGLLLIYLGWKGVLEPMVMIPMGLGMVAINCGTLLMPDGTLGNLFLDPMLSDTDDLMNTMQIDFLQPVYTLTFSNGLIACFVFMGIGTLLDVGFLLQKPFVSLFLALCAGALYISGDSMYPILKSGDIVGFKEMNSFSNVIYGEMYLVSFDIDGDEYLAVKYVNRSEQEGCIKLVSYNPHHEPMDVPFASIQAMAIVKFSIRKNMMM